MVYYHLLVFVLCADFDFSSYTRSPPLYSPTVPLHSLMVYYHLLVFVLCADFIFSLLIYTKYTYTPCSLVADAVRRSRPGHLRLTFFEQELARRRRKIFSDTF